MLYAREPFLLIKVFVIMDDHGRGSGAIRGESPDRVICVMLLAPVGAREKLRAPGERVNAQLKTWKILSKLRCCPWRAGHLAKAIHVLQVREA